MARTAVGWMLRFAKGLAPQRAADTTIAALALRGGASLFEAAVIANAAAGVVVGKVGTATASADEVCEALPAALAAAQGRGR